MKWLDRWRARIKPGRARVYAAIGGFLLAWLAGGRWVTASFTRDMCLGAAFSSAPRREAAVAFVTVGDDDLAKYPARDPQYLDRKVYARVIDKITEYGAKVIVEMPRAAAM